MKKNILEALRFCAAAVVFGGIVAVNLVLFFPVFQNLPEEINCGTFLVSRGILSHIWLGQVLGIGVLLALKILPKGGD